MVAEPMYIVYDPPQPGLPFLGVLIMPEQPLRVWKFESFLEAREFLTTHALRHLEFEVARARPV